MSSHRRMFALVALLAVAGIGLSAAPAAPVNASSQPRDIREDMVQAAEEASQREPTPLGRERTAVPEDRYALAGGCYTLRSTKTGQTVQRTLVSSSGDGDTYHAAPPDGLAERFHLQATDLGSYLLLDTFHEFLAASEGTAGELADAFTDSSVGGAVGGLTREETDRLAEEVAAGPAGTATGRGRQIVSADGASELADWEVTETDDGAFRLTLPVLDRVLVTGDGGALLLAEPGEVADGADRFTFALTDGCAQWPDIDPGVEGEIVGGEVPYGETVGYLEAHLHMMAFEFLGGRARCGRPWHPYGVEYALQGCKEHELLGGRGAVLETVLSGRDPVAGHDTNAGWPTFTDWPKHDSLTYEQVHWRWLERAWRGGLRMFVNLLVDNNVLCEVYPYKRNSCNEMDGVRLQAERIRELERYIDAQYGGPGRGWFRIVADPFEARRVMNSGKLAVVLGIEVSVPFDCTLFMGVPLCDEDQINEALDEVYALGVRQMELVNKFDNALSGVTGDAGPTGIIVNGGNALETGRYWQMETCDEEHQHEHGHGADKTQMNVRDDGGAPEELFGRDALVGIILAEAGKTGAAPAYPEGPHCNILGLSSLGGHVIRGMIERGMIFDPDHMSARARAAAMDVIEAEGHSGVISSHGWADDTIYPRILEAGGVVTPHAGTSRSFVQKWQHQLQWVDDRFYWGLGFGADTNGFSTQGGPRGADQPDAVTYPFTGFGGVTVHPQVSGERTFDINTDGVAHYGLYVDWLEDLRRLAGEEILADMQRGPESYLQMWERSVGVAPDSCRPDVAGLGDEQLAALQAGMSPEAVLLAVGQPRLRAAGSFTYCLDSGGTAEVRFGDDERLTEVQRSEDTDVADSAGFEVTPPSRATTALDAHVWQDGICLLHGHGQAGFEAAASGEHRHVATAARTAADPVRDIAVLLFSGLLLVTQLRRRLLP